MPEAGVAESLKNVELLTASVGPQAQTLAPATQAILKANLGVETRINAVERAVLNDELKKGQWDLSLNTIGFLRLKNHSMAPSGKYLAIGYLRETSRFASIGCTMNANGVISPSFRRTACGLRPRFCR